VKRAHSLRPDSSAVPAAVVSDPTASGASVRPTRFFRVLAGVSARRVRGLSLLASFFGRDRRLAVGCLLDPAMVEFPGRCCHTDSRPRVVAPCGCFGARRPTGTCAGAQVSCTPRTRGSQALRLFRVPSLSLWWIPGPSRSSRPRGLSCRDHRADPGSCPGGSVGLGSGTGAAAHLHPEGQGRRSGGRGDRGHGTEGAQYWSLDGMVYDCELDELVERRSATGA